ncbi:carbon catabolite repression protein cred [Patellaria atrata CBS 101060]|uniref:Carbon catabolite repression protein cred n=1 Tax=Patellaria atrata CBS 101060 TaxID=1346257 RepID=A0A9P4S7V6_9PEZI|nr:carbon catabolite repression protein cred [Patellaria atrata CBS 101060]
MVFGSGQSHKPQVEILPDSKYVTFYGTDAEAAGLDVTGRLILTNSDHVDIKSIKLVLNGVRKVSFLAKMANPQQVTTREVIMNESSVLYPIEGQKKKAHRFGPGRHEWNWAFKMPANAPQSVAGLGSSYVRYTLTASVQTGMMDKNIEKEKLLYVMKAPPRDTVDTEPSEQVNEDIWTNKISYRITVPRIKFIYGTWVNVDFVLTPLKKGLSIGKITMEVHEKITLATEKWGRTCTNTDTITVTRKELDMPEDAEHLGSSDDPDNLYDESYRFKCTLELPKDLKLCRPTVETDAIKIEHKLRLHVNLLNPEGHTSQLLVKNMLKLYHSPHMPMGDDLCVSMAQLSLTEESVHSDLAAIAPPPHYGEHTLDMVVDGDDPNIITPALRHSPHGSHVATPIHGSRRPSVEDISLGAIAAEDARDGASATQLHSRLSGLQDHGSSRWARAQVIDSLQSSGQNTPHNGLDDRQAYFWPHDDVVQAQYDIEALSRIPSYNTAARTPIRTPALEGLPTYEAATSRPSSPSPHARQSHGGTGLRSLPEGVSLDDNQSMTTSSTDERR